MSYKYEVLWADVKNELRCGTYVGAEVYEYKDRRERLHGDFIRYIGLPEEVDIPDNALCEIHEMDEEEYNEVMNSNDDFGELYGDKDGKMLVVMLPYGELDT